MDVTTGVVTEVFLGIVWISQLDLRVSRRGKDGTATLREFWPNS